MTNPVVNANNLKSRSILAILMAGSFLAHGAWAPLQRPWVLAR
jgi:hypothetical protein